MDNSSLFGEKEALYGCLASQHGLGFSGFARLMGRFGSPQDVYAASPESWKEAHPQLSKAMIESLSRGPRLSLWETLVEDCRAHGISMTAPGRPGYPQPLLDLEAPPPLLYLRGEWLPEDARAVALVGTRNPTAYGREAAFRLARDLAGAGYVTVSGLAVGIDAAAHAGALDEGGRTLAVIGCGLDIAYPVENLGVRERIEAHGAVISEFPPGTQPWPSHFPRRNRLISALSRATVVVEAGGRSGALLTAAHARNQHKLLFAVPGPIFSPVASGTNALLRKGALLAGSAADITAALDGTAAPRRYRENEEPQETKRPRAGRQVARRNPKGRPSLPMSGTTRALSLPDDPVLRLWGSDEVCAVDTLTARAGEHGLWPRERAATALIESLLQLELRGLVQRLPGAAYRLSGLTGRP
jgi:DNA processing protein